MRTRGGSVAADVADLSSQTRPVTFVVAGLSACFPATVLYREHEKDLTGNSNVGSCVRIEVLRVVRGCGGLRASGPWLPGGAAANNP